MKVIGNFYFKCTNSGNLIGEYTNINVKHVFCETAVKSNNHNDGFIGIYHTIWNELEICELYILNITRENLKYKLEWRKNDENRTYYIGEGFEIDNILIGMYYSI